MAKHKKTVKRETFLRQRDGDNCWFCGMVMRFRPLGSKRPRSLIDATIDHIVPREDGGSSHYNNLKLAHGYCNSARKCYTLDYIVPNIMPRVSKWLEPRPDRIAYVFSLTPTEEDDRISA